MIRSPAILIVTVIAVIASCYIALADMTCEMCGRPITGAYYRTSDGHTYCGDCQNKYKACARCGQLTRSPINADGRIYCQACYAKLDRCSLCGASLSGSYTEYPEINLKVCSKCEREKPRCQACGVPVNNLIMIGKTGLCERCAARVERCHSCGQPILGEYTFYEGNKNFKYCLDCIAKYPHCADCGAPSGPDGTRLDDGRYLCPDCRRQAFFEASLVTSFKKKVLSYLENYMGMVIKHNVDYSLQGQDYLKAKSKNSHEDLNGLFFRVGDDFNIYVLYGLREKDLLMVLPHEITHAWQAENCRDNNSFEDREGFAQWIAYKTLDYFGHDDFARLMTEGNNPYTPGLLRMLNIEKTAGPKAVFDYIKSR